MKRTFPLTATGKDDARVRDKIRHEINKFVGRERRKPLPDGYAYWDFVCKAGPTAAEAAPRTLKELPHVVDTVAQAGATEIFLEIVAQPVQRARRSTP